MRSRCAIVTALVLALALIAAPAYAAGNHFFAQQDTQDAETEGETGGGGQGQGEPAAETGSEEEATEQAVTETGPPWTFQMARIALALTLLLALAIARWFYKLVVSRARGAA